MAELWRENLKYFRKKSKKTQADIAFQVNTSHQTIGNWETGVSSPSIDDLYRISNFLGIKLDDLFGDAYLNKNSKGKEKAYPNAYPNAYLSDENSLMLREPEVKFSPKVITIDGSGKENILYVSAKARAGYLRGYGDPEYLAKLPAFSMPGLRNGTFRMFDVSGPSMAPTVGDNDRVIGRYVESLNDITDDRVYIVVTKNDGIVLKRVLNRVSQRNKIILKSDTIAHRTEFKTYEISPEDILEIWYAYIKISADFSAPLELYQRVNDLESDMIEQQAITTQLLQTMEDMQRRLK